MRKFKAEIFKTSNGEEAFAIDLCYNVTDFNNACYCGAIGKPIYLCHDPSSSSGACNCGATGVAIDLCYDSSSDVTACDCSV